MLMHFNECKMHSLTFKEMEESPRAGYVIHGAYRDWYGVRDWSGDVSSCLVDKVQASGCIVEG